MVIAVVHSLCGVVGGQVMRRRILGRAVAAPLAQGLLGAVGGVDVVAQDARLAGLSHGHVEHPSVVLVARKRLGAAGGRSDLMGVGLGRLVIWDSGNIRDPGLKAGAPRPSVTAAYAGGGRWRLPILMEPEEEREGCQWFYDKLIGVLDKIRPLYYPWGELCCCQKRYKALVGRECAQVNNTNRKK